MNDVRVEQLLHEVIEEELASLKDVEPGTNDYKIRIDCITKLTDRAIEIDKLNIEAKAKEESRKIEEELKLKELEEKKLSRKIEEELKLKELEEKKLSREFDEKFKHKQMDEESRNRWIVNGIAIAGIVIPSVITVWGTIKSIKFEETGTITTIMGRGFINKLLPKK